VAYLSGRVNGLSALSNCRKLVCLDLSLIQGSFEVRDILRVVSTLSSLKIFQFPRASPTSSDWGENEATPEWPDRLEKFYIPCSLDPGYIRAFEKVPASLTSLTIENEGAPNDDVLDTVFKLIGPQILTLKVECEELPQGQIANLTVNFPNLLHLGVRGGFTCSHEIRTINLGVERPLRAITIDLSELDDVTDPEYLGWVKDLFDEKRLPNIRRLMLSSEWSLTH
jgi:hypothetical protein